MSVETETLASPTEIASASDAKFSGWSIVGIAFTAQFLANAITLSAFGNFVPPPLPKSFGVERSTIGFGLSIAVLTLGVAGLSWAAGSTGDSRGA